MFVLTVLIVEADRLFRWSLRESLEEAGYRVLEAKNGVEASLNARQGPIDLVLLDGQLPDATGLHVLRWLRKTGSCFPVILMTAFPNGEERSEALGEGAWRYISKPNNPAKLVSLVNEVLQPLPR
ncbi:MAG: response regulator [Planctomycetes bacterium]|nr:response regulator [Planctomycetota bacterium]